MEFGCNRLTPSRRYRLRTRIEFEESQGCRSTRISEDLTELGEEHGEQRLDFVFGASHFIGELGMQPHQFAIGGNQIARHIASTSFSTQEYARNRGGIQVICFRSQTPLLGKLMGLSGMQETQLIPTTFQKVGEILSIPRSRFQTNEHLLRWDS